MPRPAHRQVLLVPDVIGDGGAQRILNLAAAIRVDAAKQTLAGAARVEPDDFPILDDLICRYHNGLPPRLAREYLRRAGVKERR